MHNEVNARLVLASKNKYTGVVLYTWVLTFPRSILAEVNTHRMASKNTASSRAIPTKKQRERILGDPFVPYHWGANQKGMQASAELTGWRRKTSIAIWRGLRYPQVWGSWLLEKLGNHKQNVNRLLEPWMWCEQVFSATDLKNFFRLRDHWMAEPHFQILAKQMHNDVQVVENWFACSQDRHKTSHIPNGGPTMQILEEGEWHLPFVEWQDWDDAILRGEYGSGSEWDIERLKIVSAARCARVSYFLPESGHLSDYSRDKELHDRLVIRGMKGDDTGNPWKDRDPIHASPVEHQATPLVLDAYSGNFRSWMQYRKEFAGEDGGDRPSIKELTIQ